MEADAISKLEDTDSWGIDDQSFQFLQDRFGIFTFDRFADSSNHKVDRFSARYFCPGVESVGAFTEDWRGEFNWICPPIALVGAALKHLKACDASGVLLVPEWKSAYFWPMLVNKGGSFFKDFITDFEVLDPFFTTYNASSGRNVFEGYAKFRTLALLIKF